MGYAEGQALQDGSFIVRQRDAHAWPEVYFPGYGWVEFEPTASQPVLFRREGSASDPTDLNSTSAADQASLLQQQEDRLNRLRDIGLGESGGAVASTTTPFQFALVIGSGALGIGILFLLAIRLRVRINLAPVPIWMERSMLRMGFRPPKRLTEWSQRASLPAIPRAYLEISRALARLGLAASPSATPNERASALIEDLPAVTQPTNQLVQRYQMDIFSAHNAENSDQEGALEAGRQIRDLSFKAMVQRFFQRLLARVQQPTSRTARDWRRSQ